MNSETMNRGPWLPLALFLALLAAILTGWSPWYWPNAVALSSIAAIAIAWAFAGPPLSLPWETILAGGIAGWGFVQIAMGLTRVPSMTLRASLLWTGCACAFVLGASILNDPNARGLFLRITMWTFTILALEAVLQFFLSPRMVLGVFEGAESVVGTMFYRNQFAALMEIGAAIALWQADRGRPVTGALSYASMLGAVVATASRAGTVLLLAQLVLYMALTAFRRAGSRGSRLAGLTLLLFAVLATAVVGTESIWDRFQQKNMFAIRTELRASTLRMISDAPVLGTGLGTWRAAYPRYATLDAAVIANEAHNDWLQWLADGGVLFFGLLLLLALRASIAGSPPIWGLGLPAVAIHCLVDYQMRAPAVAFFWFTLAGAACVYRNSSRSPGTAAIGNPASTHPRAK